MTYTDKRTGKKLYPVCAWEPNQHKLYNAHDRISNAIYDALDAGEYDKAGKLQEALERLEKAMGAFDGYVIKGIVYATWENSCLIKDYVAAYNARH